MIERRRNMNCKQMNFTLAAARFLLTASMVFFVGCGPSVCKPIPAQGKITFGGGAWPKPGILYFNPVESPECVPKRPATGRFDTDGNLTVTTFEQGDGLLPGSYKIGVECWLVPPEMGSMAPARSAVNSKYQSAASSGLELVVKPDEHLVDIRLDVSKQ